MALAPSVGTMSASARLASQVTLTVILPSQLLSEAGMIPPSGPGWAGVSMAPGLMSGSQSLQSPWAMLHPSLSKSSLGPGLHAPPFAPPVEPVDPLDPEDPPAPVKPVGCEAAEHAASSATVATTPRRI